MKRIAIILAVLLLSACADGASTASCGRAIVVAGATIPELAGCAVQAEPTADAIAAAVDQARATSGLPRAVVIGVGVGGTAALEFAARRTGLSDMTQVWFGSYDPATVAGVHNSMVTTYLNSGPDGSCMGPAEQIRGAWAPAACRVWPSTVFGDEQAAEAVRLARLINY